MGFGSEQKKAEQCLLTDVSYWAEEGVRASYVFSPPCKAYRGLSLPSFPHGLMITDLLHPVPQAPCTWILITKFELYSQHYNYKVGWMCSFFFCFLFCFVFFLTNEETGKQRWSDFLQGSYSAGHGRRTQFQLPPSLQTNFCNGTASSCILGTDLFWIKTVIKVTSVLLMSFQTWLFRIHFHSPIYPGPTAPSPAPPNHPFRWQLRIQSLLPLSLSLLPHSQSLGHVCSSAQKTNELGHAYAW